LFYSAWKLLGHLLDFDSEQTKVSWTSPKFWWSAFKSLASHIIPKKEDKTARERIKESADVAAKERASIKV